MKIKNATIKELLRKYNEISLLSKTKAVLDWDLNVNLPLKAAEGRAAQSGYITKLITNLWLNDDFKRLLEKANTLNNLTEEENAIVRNLKVGGKFYYQVPKELIIEKEQTASKAFMAWKEAKEKNEFSLFLPLLKESIIERYEGVR